MDEPIVQNTNVSKFMLNKIRNFRPDALWDQFRQSDSDSWHVKSEKQDHQAMMMFVYL